MNYYPPLNQIELNSPANIEDTIATHRSKNQRETEVEIRLASKSDASMLARLRYNLRSSLHEVIENDVTFIERCTPWMEKRLRRGSTWKCWIAEWNQTPVGNVWVQLIEKIPNPIAEPEHFVYLTNFFVSEEHRGNGIGTMLLSTALVWSKSRNAEMVMLCPTERSRTLYLRHGFSSADGMMQLAIK
jgi:GNAT superfamily N-acetyltransferase